MAEDRRRGAVDRINSTVDTVRKARTAYKLARSAGTAAEAVSTSGIWVPIAIVAVVILIVVFIILLNGGGASVGLSKEESTPGGGSPGSGNISTCQFTRSGQQVNTIKSSILAGWINDAAASAGIPPSVLASVAMHENPGFLTTYDNNSPEITSNHFCGSEGISCTNTTTNTNLHVGACTPLDGPNAVTDRHRGLLQISSYFYPNVDACNITESLTWAAIKLKDYILTSSPTEAQVKAAVIAYGGFTPGQPCTSHAGYPYDYCNEVWQDYQSCQTPVNIDASSCPIPNGVVNCGSRNRPINGPLGLCGHCGVGYGAEATAANCGFPGTEYAMDIGGADFSPVYLPKIGGNMIRWTFVGEGQGSQAIQRYTGVDDLTHEQYFISFHHTQSGSGNPGTHLSGAEGGKICGNGCNMGHVHVEFGTGNQGSYLDAPDYFCRR